MTAAQARGTIPRMSQLDSLQQSIGVTDEVTVLQFVMHLVLGLVLSLTLAGVYVRCGQSLSNRRKFASNFFVVTTCTLVIITLIKSSLALSLGLVGALSIIRFRAAIKEPEELSFLFVAIMLGLGLGASQPLITVVAFVFIVTGLLVRHLAGRKAAPFDNLYINIRHDESAPADLVTRATEILRRYCDLVDLRRVDTATSFAEAAFLVELKDAGRLDGMLGELRSLGPAVGVTMIDNKGVA